MRLRKLGIILIGLIFVLSLAGLAFAQEKAKTDKPAKPEGTSAEGIKTEEVKKEASPKPEIYRLGGNVVAIHAAARKITIKQDTVNKYRKVTLNVNNKAVGELSGIKVGDVVNLWVTGNTVTAIIKAY